MNALLIFVGGGLGSLCRWGLASGITHLTAGSALHRFPLGILACNLLGSLLVGVLFGFFPRHYQATWVFPLLATGFLGGFTTFSTFANDTRVLFDGNFNLMAWANLLLSVAGGLAAVIAGFKLGMRIA